MRKTKLISTLITVIMVISMIPSFVMADGDNPDNDTRGFVERLYTVALGREADEAGLDYWTERLNSHTASSISVARGFIFSEECIAATADNAAYISVLYRAILGREPDEAGLAEWTRRLSAGESRTSIFNGFVYSDEFRAICESYGLGRMIDPDRPMVALTFDDGPGARTDEIINILQQTNQAATFFVVGLNAQYHVDTLRHMEEAGCEIGNHTFNHAYITRLSPEALNDEIESTNSYIRQATGHDATLLRPPGGSHNEASDALVGLPIILWSVDTRDWQTRSTEATINSVLSSVSDGSIILMHDIHPTTVDAALYLIPELQRRGYQLVTVSELAAYRGGMTAGNAYRSFRP